MASRGREFGGHRFLYTLWAVLETMLFGGLINGWASLVFVLKEDGLYSDLCMPASTDNGTSLAQTEESAICIEQDAMLNLWFTIAAALRNIIGIVVGLHVFRFGTRSARLTGWVVFSLGALMMAFADQSNPWLVLPALVTLSYGGVTLLLTNVQISCLFPRAANVVITIIAGAFDFSATTQLMVKLLYEAGVLSRLQTYLGLGGIHGVMVLISTLCFMPKDMFTQPSSDASGEEEDFPPTPPPDLRKRRNSLYDWSEIKVHAHNHRLHCGTCDDSSSLSELREHHTSKSTRGEDVTKTTDFGNHAPREGVALGEEKSRDEINPRSYAMTEEPVLKKEALNDKVVIIGQGSGQPSETKSVYRLNGRVLNRRAEFHPRFTASRKIALQNQQNQYNSTSYLSTVAGDVKPFFHSQGGLNGSNQGGSISTISGSLSEESSRIRRVLIRGKSISIIEVGGFRENHSIDRSLMPSIGQKTSGSEAEASGMERQIANGSPSTLTSDDVNITKLADNKETVKQVRHHNVTLDVNKDITGGSSEGGDGQAEKASKAGQQQEEEMYPTLKKCLVSQLFWLHIVWFSFNALRLVAFFGLINAKLTVMFHSEKDKVSYFTNVLAYSTAAIMLICWVPGAVYDWQASVFKDRTKSFQRHVLPGALPLVVTSLLGVVISVLWMIDSEMILYLMFALLVFYNSFIFGICMSFELRVFPSRYFGILNGVLSMVAGTFCFLQYGIFRWHDAYPDGPLHAEIFMLTMVLLSLIHPLYIIIKGFLF